MNNLFKQVITKHKMNNNKNLFVAGGLLVGIAGTSLACYLFPKLQKYFGKNKITQQVEANINSPKSQSVETNIDAPISQDEPKPSFEKIDLSKLNGRYTYSDNMKIIADGVMNTILNDTVKLTAELQTMCEQEETEKKNGTFNEEASQERTKKIQNHQEVLKIYLDLAKKVHVYQSSI